MISTIGLELVLILATPLDFPSNRSEEVQLLDEISYTVISITKTIKYD